LRYNTIDDLGILKKNLLFFMELERIDFKSGPWKNSAKARACWHGHSAYFAQFLGIDLEISSLSSSTNSKPIEYCREVRMQSD
jgi:hypothetical protein